MWPKIPSICRSIKAPVFTFQNYFYFLFLYLKCNSFRLRHFCKLNCIWIYFFFNFFRVICCRAISERLTDLFERDKQMVFFYQKFNNGNNSTKWSFSESEPKASDTIGQTKLHAKLTERLFIWCLHHRWKSFFFRRCSDFRQLEHVKFLV